MLLSSVIIILREVLEGALLMSVLLALSSHRGFNFRWSLVAIASGIIGAFIYAAEFQTISTWFDYGGQEIVNASLHIFIVLFLTGFALLYPIHNKYIFKTGYPIAGHNYFYDRCGFINCGTRRLRNYTLPFQLPG